MKYIREATPAEINNALRKYFGCATADDFWEVKGLYAIEGDKCYVSLDGNIYFHMQQNTSNFTYFSLLPGKMSNIRAAFEVLYELICAGYPFIRINGRNGRYKHFLNHFGHYVPAETLYEGHEEFVWFIGHPETIDKIRKRIDKD